MSTVTRALGEFVATRSLDAEPPALRLKAARLIADSAACIVAGAGSEIAPGLLRYAQGAAPGPVPILGTALTASAEAAALVNGAFGHALEYDDVFSMLPGHPAVVMLAAMTNDVARRRVTARELTDAFVIGYETCARIGIAMTLEHHRARGFHATATLGLFGAAAALARLRKMDAAGSTRVFSVAASFASGLLAQIGTPMKSVHSGWAARNALAAADLVAAGIEGADTVLESPKGFFNAYGTGASRVERVLEDIGQPWVILRPGVSLKKYPCCFAAHRGIDATLMLRREHGVGFAEVATIECRLPPKGLVNMVYRRPQTGLEAKFSMEYCFVTALMDGAPGLAAFTDAQVRRPEAQAALAMVTCIEDEACEEGLGEAGGEVSGARGHVQITLVLHDGRRLVQRVAHAPGTPARELTDEELDHKFGLCAAHAGFAPDAAQRLRAELAAWRRADETVLSLEPLRRPR
jgi:2-methylcitrate dehydratase PrpD